MHMFHNVRPSGDEGARCAHDGHEHGYNDDDGMVPLPSEQRCIRKNGNENQDYHAQGIAYQA